MRTDNFDELYRAYFRRLSQDPPLDAWPAISDEAYKHSFESLGQEPPDGSWEAVEYRLSTAKRGKRVKYALAFAALVVTLVGGWIMIFTSEAAISNGLSAARRQGAADYYSSGMEKRSGRGGTQAASAVRGAGAAQKAPGVRPSLHNTIGSQSEREHSEAAVKHPTESLFTNSGVQFSDLPVTEEGVMEDVDLAANDTLSGLETNKEVTAVNADSTKVNKDSLFAGILPLGWFAGVGVSGSYLTSVNPNVAYGLNRRSHLLLKNKLDAAYAIGAEWHPSSSYGIKIDLFFDKEQGYRYGSYDEGKFVEHELRLNYTQADFVWKRKHARKWNSACAASFNWMLGAYGAYLGGATTISGSTSLNTFREYKKYDAGFIAGLGYDLYINRKWMISSSVQASTGAVNVFNGNARMPSSFNQTRNVSVSAMLGVKYRLNQ